MVEREDLARILGFVGERWTREAGTPSSRIFEGLPDDFWMNSVGGRTAKGGFWVTALMYTESEADAAAFREVLLRWQQRGRDRGGGPDLIQIGGRGKQDASDQAPP